MSRELINVSKLSISFSQYVRGLKQNNLKTISDLTLRVNKGEVVAILGSSGSGKSLLAHAILGILPENANCLGDIIYKGELLDQKRKEELRGNEICLIPQSVNFLDPLMKIYQQAIGDVKDKEEEKIKRKHQREIFAKYGLDESVDDMYPFELSGGMARKVLLSTALLSNPELVVADEPTPGLDERSVDETIKDIRRMAEEGKGVILITHEINVALRTADIIAIFYAGYVIEVNSIENFQSSNTVLHPFTKALIDALPKNGFKLTKGVQPLDKVPGCIYEDNCPYKTEICTKVNPDLIQYGDAMIRCHLYKEDKNES